ncbi:MAG TPA: hypothetical protein VN960_01050 [Gaiellaceae bacterium]|nr:hypothetical protein [Gaiellaceae bacterium]
MSWLSVALLACAVVAVIGAEWPRLSRRLGLEARRKRDRARRKSHLRLLRSDTRSDTDDFAASVERDLEQLPTLEDFDRRN